MKRLQGRAGIKRSPLSDETRRKMSEMRKGKALPHFFMKKPWLSEKQRGENNPNWRGGTSSIRDVIRKTEKYDAWRISIFVRDNRTCLNCGGRNKEIEAHHINTFADIIHENKIKTLEDALNCDLLWDVSNGVTLCKDCHNLTMGDVSRFN